MKTRHVASTIAAAAVVVGVAACSPNEEPSDATTSASSHATMDHGAGDHHASSQAPADGDHSDADVMFAQMMLPHHKQAIVMSDIMLAKNDIPENVTELAQQIKDAQGPEITELTGWLTAWGAPVDAPMDHEMDGMLSDADIDKLRTATGADAAKLFLTQMIEHHEGAVEMAEQQIENGKNSDAVEMARSIVESQQKEIDDMKAMLKEL
ncbi:DUF305 domain-containing protein [Gordonia hydrophobica]|uniref:DUF305 domain-containing protein n=1 Tax=Gordonia hydrophobica TaxID=40516 RepID=A0ABZ2TXZ5_9ACTN|nr:DUF305 domain-containing protein [Gordonia hydrophobica]MBM7366471.1 uncharacterized protein (DUF305 family) [Gordonia hydrophobica]